MKHQLTCALTTTPRFFTNSKQTIKKDNWTKYHFYLRSHTNNIPFLNSINDIDDLTQEFTHEISKALDHSTTSKEIDCKIPFQTPEEIKELIREKRKARKKAQRTCDPTDIRKANRLNNQVRNTLQQYHSERWESKLEKLAEDPPLNSTWNKETQQPESQHFFITL